MNIVDLESFVMVTESGSIVGAAAKMHLTQSAITRRIQNLEESLGVTLFDRQSRPIQLTAAGRATYESAKPVLCSVGDLRSAVVHNGEPSGSFRFGIARGLGDGALLLPITHLREAFPLVRLQAFSQWTEELVNRIQCKSLDAAVVLLPEGAAPPPNMESEYVGKQALIVVSSKDSPLAKVRTLHDLSEVGWILSPETCGTRSQVEAALARQRLPFTVAVETEGKDLQLSLVAKNVGLGVVPKQVYMASVLRKQLAVLRLKDFVPSQDLWIVRQRNTNSQTKLIAALKKSLAEALRVDSASCHRV
jgi:DNA-binding transcriptional LysR family regulator